MMYQVMKPEFETTGERTPDGRMVYRVRDWVVLGMAKDMEDAKRLHPAPVLVPATRH